MLYQHYGNFLDCTIKLMSGVPFLPIGFCGKNSRGSSLDQSESMMIGFVNSIVVQNVSIFKQKEFEQSEVTEVNWKGRNQKDIENELEESLPSFIHSFLSFFLSFTGFQSDSSPFQESSQKTSSFPSPPLPHAPSFHSPIICARVLELRSQSCMTRS